MFTIDQVHPLYDRIVLRRLDRGEDITTGGILIPDVSQELGDAAEVVRVGKGRVEDGKRIPVSLKEGDTVMINRYAGTELTCDQEKFLLVKEDDVLSTVIDA